MAPVMTDVITGAISVVVPMVFAIVLHEIAHGWVARLLGDPTAAERGRLSLNPLRHVDPFGTIVLPGALYLAGMPPFGWAKPVPVNYARLRNPKRDMALVGAAGPACNFVLAVASAVVIGLIARATGPQGTPNGFVIELLTNFVLFNCVLGLFNLLPIPPFDGSRILRGFLPWSGVRLLDRIEPFGILVFFLLFVLLPQVVPSLHLVDRVLGPPVSWAIQHLNTLIDHVAGGSVA
jgi:Zn-dependent protease